MLLPSVSVISHCVMPCFKSFRSSLVGRYDGKSLAVIVVQIPHKMLNHDAPAPACSSSDTFRYSSDIPFQQKQ